MASGDIHITVVPAVSTVAPYPVVNAYGHQGTTNEKSIASNPALLSQFINETQDAAPAKTLIQVLDREKRLTLVLKED